MGLGCMFTGVELLVLMLLPGSFVLASCATFLPFLGTLHWPVGAVDMRHVGASFSEILILFEQWAGHRLLSELATRSHVRANRSLLIPSVPVSE